MRSGETLMSDDDALTLTKLAWMAVCTPSLEAQDMLLVLVDALLEKEIIQPRNPPEGSRAFPGNMAALGQQWLLKQAWHWATHQAITIERIMLKTALRVARVPLSFPTTILPPRESQVLRVNPSVSFHGDRLAISEGAYSVVIDDLVMGNIRTFMNSVPGDHFSMSALPIDLDLPTIRPDQTAALHVSNPTDNEVQFSATLFGQSPIP